MDKDELFRDLINSKFEEVKSTMDAMHENQQLMFDQIISNQEKMEDRIDILESDTDFFTTLTKYKKLTFFAAVGIIAFTVYVGVDKLIKLF
jgi:hypothetical protein